MQMSNIHEQFEMLEANLQRLSARVPDLPVTGILLARLLVNLGREMASVLDQQIRPFGLTEAEFRALTTLYAQPEGVAHPSDLCARTSQSPANMSRLTDALVDRGLITRVMSMHDRRKMVLHVTDQGGELVRRLLPTLFAPLHAISEEFSEKEQRRMIAELKRLGAKLDETVTQDATQPSE
jgi:MarR family transcriptional repressor of emrRAB